MLALAGAQVVACGRRLDRLEALAAGIRSVVRVNAIAPGWFASELTDELLADERSRRWLERQCPMGRIGRVHELDRILLYLASDASSYCTGQVISVDGGWTIR